MIDTDELRRKINSTDAVDHIDLHANIKPFLSELIDRLEAAEKSDAESIAMYRKARDERDTLRAELSKQQALTSDPAVNGGYKLVSVRLTPKTGDSRMEAKYTLGPWHYEPADGFYGEIVNADGDCVATFVDEPSVQNAMLLTAAPELLRALICMVLRAEEAGYPDGKCLEMARAAIAKATGE